MCRPIPKGRLLSEKWVPCFCNIRVRIEQPICVYSPSEKWVSCFCNIPGQNWATHLCVYSVSQRSGFHVLVPRSIPGQNRTLHCLVVPFILTLESREVIFNNPIDKFSHTLLKAGNQGEKASSMSWVTTILQISPYNQTQGENKTSIFNMEWT